MIKEFQIKNFKSHKDTKLRLSNLNIFTGLNGMGKSSVIQALLLLRQTYLKNMLNIGLELNSELCSIGIAKDAIYQYAEADIISLIIETENFKNEWNFEVENAKLDSTFIKTTKKLSVRNIENPLTDFSLFNNNFQYISAYRNGPEKNYDKSTSTVEIFEQISSKEGRCELIAHFLDHFRKYKVAEHLKYLPKGDSDLFFQTQQWLRVISPEINIHLLSEETTFRMTYSYNRGEYNAGTNDFSAINVGFGVSYVLPIIAAILYAKPNSIIIIENPESHIHPSAQAKLMELISKAANAGVQFFIETHSDHIINGLLVSLKKEIIETENASVYFMDKDIYTHSTISHKIQIAPNSRIKNAPLGFFDQIANDLRVLIRTKQKTNG